MTLEWMRFSDIVWHEMDDAAVLVNAATRKTWVLNKSAAYVWKLCDGRSLEELAR